MTRIGLVLGLVLALLPGAGLAFPVTDQTGRRIELAGPPERIVSLVPSVTEIVFTIGAQDRLAGVTDFCNFPAAARKKPRVGGMIAPNLESIVALRPDLVVATTEGNRHETFDQLAALGIPVSSQTLVFSKTSFQYAKISPERPRALYFNDDVYVGQVHEGHSLEFVSFDPMQGAIFYVLDEQKTDRPVFERALLDCVQCHVAASTKGVPGVMLRSKW